MKIDQPAPSSTPLPRTTPAPAGTAGAAAASGADAAQRAAKAAAPAPSSAHIRSLPSTAGAASDFDAARVAAIREDIRAGRYQIRPERIADGLLASVRDLLTPGASDAPAGSGQDVKKGERE